ncbi:unnamed protein product [Ilex paraguariensis]|uniref:C2H2-type domain-containing protein n=1 Tax=Ilex paraguariensis TaxID=185542 RepID=A0ABC8UZ32_9AQUA
MENLEEGIAPKDLKHIVKGKRTKRQRPQSPIPFTITTHSSTGDQGGYGSNEENINNTNNNNTYSSSTSSAERANSTTEEDQDTAKCLILLAQGHSRELPRNQNYEEFESYKFTSKRYVEAPITANGKAGIYVYECKTCNRTFPSFQALGGHRASHKKNKAMAAEETKPLVFSDDEEAPFKSNISSLSLQLSNRGIYSNNNSSKVHDCSICGAEFTSGQALGGHMRRHRGSAVTNTTLSLSPISLDRSEEGRKSRNSLSLDLNLPAPEDDHLRDKLAFTSKQQYEEHQQQQEQQQQQQQQKQKQPVLGLSTTPTLVDCHY